MARPEILIRSSEGGTANPPLLFVHGAYAGAWYWDRNFVPFFQSRGYDCISLSFRGHGNSSRRNWLWTFGIDDYVEDLATAFAEVSRPPVLVAHSMGAFVAHKLLQQKQHQVAGLVLIAPAAASGHLAAALQMLSQHPLLCWKLNLVNSSPKMFWESFMTRRELRRIMLSPATSLDSVDELLPHLQHESLRAIVEMLWPLEPPSPNYDFPVLLMGGDQDIIISPESMKRVAACLGTPPVLFAGMGHSLMLEDGWVAPAEKMLTWISDRVTGPGEMTDRHVPEASPEVARP